MNRALFERWQLLNRWCSARDADQLKKLCDIKNAVCCTIRNMFYYMLSISHAKVNGFIITISCSWHWENCKACTNTTNHEKGNNRETWNYIHLYLHLYIYIIVTIVTRASPFLNHFQNVFAFLIADLYVVCNTCSLVPQLVSAHYDLLIFISDKHLPELDSSLHY